MPILVEIKKLTIMKLIKIIYENGSRELIATDTIYNVELAHINQGKTDAYDCLTIKFGSVGYTSITFSKLVRYGDKDVLRDWEDGEKIYYAILDHLNDCNGNAQMTIKLERREEIVETRVVHNVTISDI